MSLSVGTIHAWVEQHNAHTWGVHLRDAAKQGLDPDYTVVDAGAGLRAGQVAAWSDKPCHADVFHVRQLRAALQRHRDDVLGFARVLDSKIATIAQRRSVPLYWVRQVCRMHGKKPASMAF